MKDLSVRLRANNFLRSCRPLLVASLFATMAPACALDPDSDFEHMDEAGVEDLAGSSNALAEIQVDDQTTVTFYSGDDGVIAISEVTGGDAPSPVNYLVGAQRATPLEIFNSLGDRAVEAPAMLLEDHTRRVEAELAGGDEKRSLQPRTLSLPDREQKGCGSFGTTPIREISAC